MKLSDVVIYADFDGTVSYGYHGKAFVSEEKIKSIDSFIKEGGHFGMASGRNHTSVLSYFNGYVLNLPYVEANGALIYDVSKEKYIYQNYISDEIKEKVYKHLIPNKNLMMTAMNNLGTYKIAYNDERDPVIIDFERPFMSYDQMFKEDLYKCAIIGKEEEIKKVSENIDDLGLTGKINVSSSAPFYLEIFDKEVSKGNGVKKVLKEYGLEDKVLVCLGDYMNDMSMMLEADIAICPSNAIDEIKKVSDYVTKGSCKEDIIKEVINYLKELNYVKN